jgi:hypothetical protein
MSNMAEPVAYRWTLRLIAVTGAAVHLVWLLYQSNWSPSVNTPHDWFKLIWGPVGSAVIAVLVFQFFFERWIWRRDFLRKKLVRFPDLTGTWFVTSNSKTFGTNYKSVVNIDHRFDRIILKSFRLNQKGDTVSREHSLFCGIERRLNDDSVLLYLVYENGVFKAEEYSRDHTGCRCLTLYNEESCRKKWILQGQYWTDKPVETKDNRKGGTLGSTEMKWIRKDSATEMDQDVIDFLTGETSNA